MSFHMCYFKLENFLKGHESNLPLPPVEGEDTIFEYVVNPSGDWEHWRNRVSHSNINKM